MAKRAYKFTDKKHTRRGLASTVLGLAALFLLLAPLWMAYERGGEAGTFAGLWGLLSMLGSLTGFVLGIQGFREEDAYYLFSQTGVLLNGLLFIIWVLIFILGM